MAHAVIRTGGKQFLVEEGKTIRVPSVDAEAGKSIELDVLVSSGDDTRSALPPSMASKCLRRSSIMAGRQRSSSSRRSAANNTSGNRDTVRITRR